jgi:hypothetical protein
MITLVVVAAVDDVAAAVVCGVGVETGGEGEALTLLHGDVNFS